MSTDANAGRRFGVFAIHGAGYALDVDWLGGLVPWQEPLPLPRCPAAVLGLVNLRGRPLAVVEPTRLLDLPEAEAGDEPENLRLLVLRPGRLPLAALPVGGFAGVLTAAPGGFRPADPDQDPPWMAGLQGFVERPLVAALIDTRALLARLDLLRFRRGGPAAAA